MGNGECRQRKEMPGGGGLDRPRPLFGCSAIEEEEGEEEEEIIIIRRRPLHSFNRLSVPAERLKRFYVPQSSCLRNRFEGEYIFEFPCFYNIQISLLSPHRFFKCVSKTAKSDF